MIKKFFDKILSKKDEAGKARSTTPLKHLTRKERIENSDSYIQVKETEVWEPGRSASSGNKSKDKSRRAKSATKQKDVAEDRRSKRGPAKDKVVANSSDAKKRDVRKTSPKKPLNKRSRPVTKIGKDELSSEPKSSQQPKSPKRARVPKKPRNSGKPAEPYTWTLDNYVVEPKEGEVRFHDFDLPLPLMNGIFDSDFQYCTPIQAMALPHSLAGKDVCAKALTGTGKTAAFLLTIHTLLWRNKISGERAKDQPRALILAPTRELCIQICKDSQKLGKHMPFTSFAVYGGMDLKKQQKFLQTRVVDVVCATPGRLLGFSRSKDIDLSKVEILIIDEADRMLDMGFIQDIKKIIYQTPHKDKRQTMLFSATLSTDIINLASQWMRQQVVIEDKENDLVVDNIDQQIYLVTSEQKFGILKKLLATKICTKTLVFANRKSTTRKLSERLSKAGIKNELLSGDVPQKKRLSVLERFKSGDINVIIATDVAGRGIHVDDITHVVNFELPYDAEDYVHRIGRTGRAGQKGQSVSFACEDESFIIPEIEKYMNCQLKCSLPPDELLD